jgi:hypothetical protein
MKRCAMRNNSRAINPKSTCAKKCLSSFDLDINTITAAPEDNPEIRNKGPKMDVFQRGRALKAENKIPVYTPKTRA